MTDNNEQERVEAGLKDIRFLHRLLVGILITYIPVVAGFYVMRLPEWLIIASAVIWVSAGIIVAFAIGFSRCPTCGRYFHVRGTGGGVFVKACVHCGVRLNKWGS
jgi:hypothetical protein